MKKNLLLILISLLISPSIYAFCGFYVAKGGADIFNKASQVVMVRDENRTVITMMNDFEGDYKNFAMVIPVPQVLEKSQINAGDKTNVKHLDDYTAPRLVEYHDADPCQPRIMHKFGRSGIGIQNESMLAANSMPAKKLGVKIEAEYTVGEYDIVILSAKESNGLETWLRQNKYNVPKGASKALKPYIKQKMKFFVAKVNIKEQKKAGLNFLRPLQVAFESEKFMLPIRLGMINAKGPQELFVYVLTKNGRVETSNYPNVKIPSDLDLPIFIKEEFSDFYKSMFDRQVKKEGMKAVFTEYFWDMGWCDPCAADPLSVKQLRSLGVFWLDEPNYNKRRGGIRPMPIPRGGARNVKVTRLHLRYDKKTFPQDLMFYQTKDTKNFQGRYILRHPFKFKGDGKPQCDKGKEYVKNLPARFEKEAQTLAHITDWKLKDIRKKMKLAGNSSSKKGWWKKLWE